MHGSTWRHTEGFIIKKLGLFCVYECFNYMYVVTDVCEPPCEFWEPNLSPL